MENYIYQNKLVKAIQWKANSEKEALLFLNKNNIDAGVKQLTKTHIQLFFEKGGIFIAYNDWLIKFNNDYSRVSNDIFIKLYKKV